MAPLQHSMQPLDYFAIGAGLSAWTTLYVGLRYYTRFVHRIPYGLDDMWCGLAYLLLFGLNIATGVLYLDPRGLKEVNNNLEATDIRMALTAYYANHIMYFTCMLFIKLSVIFLCLRLFTSRPFRICAAVVAFFCVAAFIGGLIPFAKGCAPDNIINLYANMSAADIDPAQVNTCENMVQLFEGVNLSNFFTNLMCLCLPLPWVWGLNVTIKQRIALSVVFLMGGVAVFISFLRVFLQNTWNDTFNTMIGNCSMWSVIEPSICLFAACLPALRPLLPANFAVPITQRGSGDAPNFSIVKAPITSPPPNYSDARRQMQANPSVGYTQNYYPPPPPSHSTVPASDNRSVSQRALGGVRKSWNRNNSFRSDARAALQPADSVMQQRTQLLASSQPQPPPQSQPRYWNRAQVWRARQPSLSSRHGRSWLSDEPDTPPQSYYDRGSYGDGYYNRGNTF